MLLPRVSTRGTILPCCHTCYMSSHNYNARNQLSEHWILSQSRPPPPPHLPSTNISQSFPPTTSSHPWIYWTSSSSSSSPCHYLSSQRHPPLMLYPALPLTLLCDVSAPLYLFGVSLPLLSLLIPPCRCICTVILQCTSFRQCDNNVNGRTVKGI